jgi:hypothetical protein
VDRTHPRRLGAKRGTADLGLTPTDGSAILRGIHPSPLGEEQRAMATLADYAEKYHIPSDFVVKPGRLSQSP